MTPDGTISARTRWVARILAIPHPTSTRWPKRALFSPVGTDRRAYRGTRVVHDGTNSDPLGPVDCGRPGRRKLPPSRNTDHCRVLQEERLHDVLLGKVAHGRQASGVLTTPGVP